MSDRQLLFFYLTDPLPDFCQTKYVLGASWFDGQQFHIFLWQFE